MKKVRDCQRKRSVTKAKRAIHTGGRSQDHLIFIALLVTGAVLVGACHYSLTQLSTFYGVMVATYAAGRSRYLG
jgi:hypothetical protein